MDTSKNPTEIWKEFEKGQQYIKTSGLKTDSMKGIIGLNQHLKPKICRDLLLIYAQ